ncbi:MAG: 3'-5' exonuclease [Thalassospira sp.]|nr:3'-5' exonuclease [Thalassospira sp.]
MTPQHLFVFDIETIPDTDLAPALTGCDSADILERREAMRQYHLKATDGKNDFLRQPFHKVVAISFAEAQIVRAGAHEAYTLVDIRSGGTETSSEKELVLGFFKYLEKKNARLVSFNGRTFDLPVLKYRALHYGIPTPWLYNTADKWNNYGSRYSFDWHCDLIEAFSDFGASARVKLHEVAVAVGLPGKFGVDGGDVAGMFDAGKIKEIRAYCETDVLNTFLLYLRLQQHRGTLATPDYNDAVTSAISYCESMDAGAQPQFGEFLDAWRSSSNGTMGIL